MAIDFLRVSFHSRSKGHKAVSGAAYRAGEALYDERYAMGHDYSKRTDVKYANIMLPEGSDSRFLDRQFLWNSVEFAENRKDSQVAIDYIVALPRELSLENQIELARDFAQYHFVSKGLVVDVAVHDHGDGNPHAHLYTTTRRLLGDQFDRYKARDLMPKIKNGFLVPEEEHIWHAKYRDFQEKFFIKKGLSLSVDLHHLLPTRHEGRIKSSEPHYLKEDNQVRLEASADIALNSPENVLNILGHQQAVFNEKVLAKQLHRYCDSHEEFQRAMAGVLAHPDCVSLGIGADGREAYTTRSNYLREANMADKAAELFSAKSHALPSSSVSRMTSKHSLSDEQSHALKHIACGSDIAVLVGRAGTGKSYLMNAAREAWEARGLTVTGVAVSGIAAKNLADEAGLSTSTIYGFKQKYLLSDRPSELSSQDVIVVDEAGMVDVNDMATLVEMTHAAGAKLVLVGDPDQLQPVGVGAPFRALASRVGFASMDKIRRQRDAGDRDASQRLSRGQVGVALDHYAQKSAVHLIDDSASQDAKLADVGQRDASYQRVVNDWFSSHNPQAPDEQLMLAHRNADVGELNHRARLQLIESGVLSGKVNPLELKRDNKTVTMELIAGERIVFLRNNAKPDVKNGQFGSVLSVDNQVITVQLDGQKAPFQFSAADYQDFDYGYAATVHKTQGVTLTRTFVYAGGAMWNRFLAYVALTRHRDSVKLYASTLDYGSLDELKANFSREEFRDNVLDFPLSFGLRRGFDSDGLVGSFLRRLVTVKAHIVDAWLFVANYEAFLLQKTQRARDAQTHSFSTSRQLAKATATYIDLARALNYERFALSKQVSGKVLFADPRYHALAKRQAELNAMAAQLWPVRDQLMEVLARNQFALDKLDKARRAHECYLRVSHYLDATQNNTVMARRVTSVAIAQDVRSHYAALAQLCTERGLSLKDIQFQLRQDAQSVQRTRLLSTLSPGEKKHFIDFERYLSARDSAKAVWRDVYARDAKLSTREKLSLRDFTTQQDRLAVGIISNAPHYKTAMTFYGIDADKLLGERLRHSRREAVKQLEALVSLVDRRELANGLLQDRENYSLLYEQGSNWKEAWALSRQHDQAQFLRGLSSGERKAYDLVARYQQSRRDAGKAWSVYFDLKAKGQPELNTSMTACRTLTEKRNALAYELFNQKNAVAPFIAKTKLPPSDIQKHAKHYRDALLKEQGKWITKPEIAATPIAPSDRGRVVRRLDADLVSQSLVAMGEDFYRQVLGEEGKRSGQQLRFGHKGSLSVTIGGSHAGAWHSFETDEGGYPLQLLMNSTYGWGLSFKEALQEGARMAGLSAEQLSVVKTLRMRKIDKATLAKKSLDEKNAQRKIQQRMASARYYWQSAQPITGTLGEKYLRKVRKITSDLSAFRFHPKIKDPASKQYYPGLVVAAKNMEGAITASQTILLDHDAQKARDVDVVKRSRGVVKGSAVLIHAGKTSGKQQIIIAEGPETAASLITALPDAHIYITLGNIKNAASLGWLCDKHQIKQLYFAADNDGPGAKNISLLNDVAKTLKLEKDIDCFVAKPTLPGKSKVDFNDVLIEKGIDGVKAQAAHFTPLTISQPKEILDEKIIEDGFDPLAAEWAVLKKQLHPSLSQLAYSYHLLEKEHPSFSLDKLKQDHNQHMEIIYCDETLLTSLKNIAPGIAKKVAEYGSKTPGLKIDWDSKEITSELSMLKQSKNNAIRTLVTDVTALKNNTDLVDKSIYINRLNKTISCLVTDEQGFAELKKTASKLSKQMKAFHQLSKKRGHKIK